MSTTSKSAAVPTVAVPTMKNAFGAMMSPDEFYGSFKGQVESMMTLHQKMIGQMQDFWKGIDLKASDWKGLEMPGMPWDLTTSGAGDLMIEDKDGTIEIVADLKGYDPADIVIEVTDDLVTMHARKRSESKKVESGGNVESEQVAAAQYAVRLASRARLDKTTAKVVDGRLQLVLPKAQFEQRKVQRIPVSAAEAA